MAHATGQENGKAVMSEESSASSAQNGQQRNRTRYTVQAQGGLLVREFSNCREAEAYARLMRAEGWPAAVTDRRRT
jgi:hypothetical protein